MFNKLKSIIVKSYYFISHKKARQLSKKNISFEHYRELNKKWLTDSDINTVIDIGANKGQFAKLSREVFSAAKIYSYEPLPDCFEELQKALPGDTNFFCFNKAIGSFPSELEFYRSIHSPSSSFLQMEDLHKEAFPESSKGQVQKPVKVEVDTLDSIFTAALPQKNILLKIDVQGFEDKVLDGGSLFLGQVKVIIIEMSLRKLYKDQPLFHDVYLKMYEKGFRYHGNLAQMYHPQTADVVQIDAVFIKEN